MKEDEIRILEPTSIELLHSQDKALLDTQVVTAKEYPRDIVKARNNSIVIATMDKKTAEACGYALPRGGKTIQGPSVHLAKIIAQNWGNIRVEAKVVDITSTQVVSQAVCFDLESNYAVKIEVRRSIVDKYGKRFKDDMITVTGNAANAISYRNAVFSVVPKQIVDSVFQETKNLLTGDLSDDAKLIKKRNDMFKYFKDSHGVTKDEILEALGVGSENGIKQDQIVTLLGLAQALRDGDTTVDEAFNRESKKKTRSAADKKKDLNSKKDNNKPQMP